MRCPDEAALAAWVDGEVVGHSAEGLGAHVAACSRCRRAERAQRQVKLRTSLLRAEVGSPRPDAQLLSLLMTVPQVEHDRALRRAHRASCGEPQTGSTGTRLRLAVVGAGAAVWLLAAVWSGPTGSTPGGPAGPTSAGITPTSAAPAGTAPAPVERLTGVRQASTDKTAER